MNRLSSFVAGLYLIWIVLGILIIPLLPDFYRLLKTPAVQCLQALPRKMT